VSIILRVLISPRLWNTLAGLGPRESVQILASYLRWQLFPYRRVETFEQWVTNAFGRWLFEHFFKIYTEKVWGIPCSELRAEWAAQRIKDLSLWVIIKEPCLQDWHRSDYAHRPISLSALGSRHDVGSGTLADSRRGRRGAPEWGCDSHP